MILFIIAIGLLVLLFLFVLWYKLVARFHRVSIVGKPPARFRHGDPVTASLQGLRNEQDLALLHLLMLRHLPVVVCLGDSITHGVISTNYVDILQERFENRYLFVNSGINGNLAYNVNRRLEEDCIELDPDIVTILIGTNDVNARESNDTATMYIRQQELPQKPNRDFFSHNLRRILSRLRSETRADIAIMSLPVIGEELDSAVNKRVTQYSQIIEDLAREFGASYIPLNEAQRAYLEEIPDRKPTPYQRQSLLKTMSLMINKSFDQIAEGQGNHLTYDGLHQTSEGGRIIARLVGDYLEERDATIGRSSETWPPRVARSSQAEVSGE